MSLPNTKTFVFAGGGTGGHIYPNVGIVDALRSKREDADVHFVVSERPSDAKTMDALALPWSASPAAPLPSLSKPASVPAALGSWTRAFARSVALLRRVRAQAVVATGGFVSGPTVLAARALRLDTVMVNLDAVPGAANRALVRVCTKVFSAYATPRLPAAEVIGLPLRAVSTSDLPAPEARRRLELSPDRPTLFITGATHGAQSIVEACVALLGSGRGSGLDYVGALDGWQVLHQCGTLDVAPLQRAYDAAGVPARVVDYLTRMGEAYASADLVLSRAGAGSVAEAWAGRVPTVFMPNPYHADQHQRFNATPMAEVGAATIVEDRIDAEANVATLGPVLVELLRDDARRHAMRAAATKSRPPDGAAAVCDWLLTRPGRS